MAPHTGYIHFIPQGRMMQRLSRAHVFVYRLTRGLIGGRADQLDMLLLTNRGRKSGVVRTTPLPYFQFPDADSGRAFVCVASNGGRPQHAAWYHNVRADAGVELQVRGRRFPARARVAEGEERSQLWKQIVDLQPRYEDYQTTTERQIPLVVFDPLEARESLAS